MSKADTKEHLEHLEDTGSPNSIHETNINIDDLDSIEQTETGKFSWLISITAAIGGMLFGYDTGIISAVLVYIHQDLGKTLTSQEKELITSITSGGAFLGAIFAGCSADRYGRKVAIYVGCVLFIIGAIIQAASFSVAQMTVGRLIVGFGVGSAAMIIPLYIAECAPSKYRGQPSMSIATTVEQPLLRAAPTAHGLSGTASRNLTAVIVAQDYGYVDTLDNVPSNIRGRIPRQIKDGERLMIWKDEMGYLFGRNPRNDDVLVLIFKGALQIPVVLPSSIIIEGKPFRDLLQQTIDQLGITSAPPAVSIQSGPSDQPLQSFIRSFFSSLSVQQGSLRSLGLRQTEIDELFTGSNYNTSLHGILDAIIPQVRQTIQNGRFSLQDILGLRHATASWPGNRPCIYVRIYTDPEDRPEIESSEGQQTDIDRYVGIYVGQARRVWVRHLQHENRIDNYVPTCGQTHYRTASKSLPEDRHTIPLLVFEDISVSNMVLNMAEQVMIASFKSQMRWTFVNQPELAFHQLMQRRARFISNTARAVCQQIGWPELAPQGLNGSSPLFEERSRNHVHCIPMATSGGPFARVFTTYRMQKSLADCHAALTVQPGDRFWRKEINLLLKKADGTHDDIKLSMALDRQGITGPNHDVKRGFLVAEIMNDIQPHPKAYVGCPSVGPFQNFLEGSRIALRFEWQADGQWYTVYLQRRKLNLSPPPTRSYDTEVVIEPYRAAMKMIQAFEGTVYTEPLNGFPQSLTIGNVQILQTDHLNQSYRWVSQQRVTRPAPARASWDFNFNLMVRNFGNELFEEFSNQRVTFVGPSNPLTAGHGAMNWDKEDYRNGMRVSDVKCDTCTVIPWVLLNGHTFNCVRDESRTDVWVCKNCSLFNRPCTFTPLSRLKQLFHGTSTVNGADTIAHLRGPFRFLSFHHTMSSQELGEVFEVSEPLFERFEGSEVEDVDYEEDT
ncbi:hypothetical protein CEK26_009976 [Fusarium fujikuroi]|nr:hypothetical protein CEK26_009976 [Fusarium fujikuroi]